jgi:peptide deformylase
VRYHADGLFAEAIEHEVDHLNGILYFDYLDSTEKLIPLTREETEEDSEEAEAEPAGGQGRR